jgi:hypothetical protein
MWPGELHANEVERDKNKTTRIKMEITTLFIAKFYEETPLTIEIFSTDGKHYPNFNLQQRFYRAIVAG